MNNNNNPSNSTPNPSYTAGDLRNMELVILKKMEKFNEEYSNYKKYLYNMRHTIKGDTSTKFTNSNGAPITSADFADLNSYVSLSPIYIDLVNSIAQFNQALQYVINHQPPPPEQTIDQLQSYDYMIIEMRNNLEKKIKELNEDEGTIFKENKRHLDASIVINILWTALATSLIYFIAAHS